MIKEVKTKVVQVMSNSFEEMISKEEDIIEKLNLYKSKHPDFNFSTERESLTHTLVVKQILMDESKN